MTTNLRPSPTARAVVRTWSMALFALVPLAACAGDGSGDAMAPAPSSTTAVTASADVRTAPARLPAPPVPGRVLVEEGAFTDRVALVELSLAPGDRPAVTGQAYVTSDVSHIILLEVVADFYDADGALVASGRQAHRDEEADAAVAGPAPPQEAVAIDVRSEAPAPTAVTALVSLPVLVNE